MLLHRPVPGAMWRSASQPQSMKGVLLHGLVPGAMWRLASQPQSMKGVLLHGPVPGAMWRFASQPQSMKGVLLHGPVPGAIEQVTMQSAVEPLVRDHLSFRKTPVFSESFAHGPLAMNCTSFKMQVF